MGNGKEITHYGKGLLRSVDIMIDFVEKEIKESKQRNPESNTPSQVYGGGALMAYNKVLNKLRGQREKILAKEEEINKFTI